MEQLTPQFYCLMGLASHFHLLYFLSILGHFFVFVFLSIFPVPVVSNPNHTHLVSPWIRSIRPRRWPSHRASQSSRSWARARACTGSVWSHSGTPRSPPPPGAPRTAAPAPHACRSARTLGSRRRRAAGWSAACFLRLRLRGSSPEGRLDQTCQHMYLPVLVLLLLFSIILIFGQLIT